MGSGEIKRGDVRAGAGRCGRHLRPGRRVGSAEDLADRRAGDVAGGLAGREEAAVERDAPGEDGLGVTARDLGFVDIVEEVQV